jgi:hypothetical protein
MTFRHLLYLFLLLQIMEIIDAFFELINFSAPSYFYIFNLICSVTFYFLLVIKLFLNKKVRAFLNS